MANLHDDLREVMGLLGKATPGPWKNNVNDDAHMGRLYGAPLADQSLPVLCKTWSAPSDTGLCCYVGTSQIQGMHNSAAIAAAVNFLRQHGPALLARQEGENDTARLDFIERKFSGMTNRERYLPVQMIWGKGANGRSVREACDKYMAAEAARSGGGG